MTRALLLPIATILALATGIALLGVAATVSTDSIAVTPATATPAAAATPPDAGTPATDPLMAEVAVELPGGSAALRVVRLSLQSGTNLSPQIAPGPVMLVVERGVISVRSEGAVWFGHGLDAAQIETTLQPGERLVVTPGVTHAIRNGGLAVAVVLVVTIESVAFLPADRATSPPSGNLRTG